MGELFQIFIIDVQTVAAYPNETRFIFHYAIHSISA